MRSPKKLILIAALLVLGIVVRPTGALASTPTGATDVPQVTNLTDTGFTVAWFSRVQETGDSVSVFSGSCGGTAAGTVTPDESINGYSHYFDISNLTPSASGSTSTYYYRVTTSDGNSYPSSTTCFAPVSTLATLSSLVTPIAVYGTVRLETAAVACSTSIPVAPGAVVTLQVTRGSTASAPVSGVTDASGHYAFDIGSIRTANGSAYFSPQSGDVFTVSFEDGNVDRLQWLWPLYPGGATRAMPDACMLPMTQYLQDSGFENPTLGGWLTSAAQSIVTSSTCASCVHSGSQAMKDNYTSSGAGFAAAQIISVAPSTTYTFDGFVNQSADTSSTQGGAVVVVRDADVNTGSPLLTAFAGPTLNAYTEINRTFTTGPATRKISVTLTRQVLGTYYWDDVSLLPTTLVNGGFEMSPLGIQSWNLSTPSGGSVGAQTSTVHSGVNSLKMVSTSAGTFATERVAVTPGSTHAISAFINQSVASGARITVWQLQSGTFIANSPLVSTTGSYTSIATPTFTVPAGVNAILIGLQISPSTGGTVYWDDVSMS